jgi:hypothetical protein
MTIARLKQALRSIRVGGHTTCGCACKLRRQQVVHTLRWSAGGDAHHDSMTPITIRVACKSPVGVR